MKKIKDTQISESQKHTDKRVNTYKQLSQTLDSLWEGVQIIDFNWCYVYVNKTLIDAEHTTKENLVGHSMLKRYPGIERTNVFEALESSMNERKKRKLEIEFTYPDQSKKWFHLSIEPVKEGILVLSLDITERKTSDEKKNRANQLYSFISQVNQNIVRVKDETTLFSNACKMALEFGKFKTAWIGLFDGDSQNILPVEHKGIPIEELREFINTRSGIPDPHEQVRKSGVPYLSNDMEHDPALKNWIPYTSKYGIQSCLILPIKKSGKVIGTFDLYAGELNFSTNLETALLVEVTSDISFALDLFEKEKSHNKDILERRRAEDMLIHNNEELQKTNLELDRFVYSASHDLRAPLTSVLGLVSLIELGSNEGDTKTYLTLIRKSVNRLEEFIRNILSYSKNNRLEPEITAIPVRTGIEEIVSSLRNMKEADSLVFQINIDEPYPFYSDLHRFNIVMENLISNAIKFQDYQRTERTISVTGRVDKDNLRLAVADNGIGIPAAYQAKVFDMFFRISGERDGSGIGLYIVKETVTKLHGTIAVQSNDLGGTTFNLQLKNFINP